MDDCLLAAALILFQGSHALVELVWAGYWFSYSEIIALLLSKDLHVFGEIRTGYDVV